MLFLDCSFVSATGPHWGNDAIIQLRYCRICRFTATLRISDALLGLWRKYSGPLLARLSPYRRQNAGASTGATNTVASSHAPHSTASVRQRGACSIMHSEATSAVPSSVKNSTGDALVGGTETSGCWSSYYKACSRSFNIHSFIHLFIFICSEKHDIIK